MIDEDEEHVTTADLVGARLTRVTTARRHRQSATASQLSHLWLHLEDLGPVLFRTSDSGLSFRADPTGTTDAPGPTRAGNTPGPTGTANTLDPTGDPADPADPPLTRFVGQSIRSVHAIEYRGDQDGRRGQDDQDRQDDRTAFTAGLALGFEGGRVRLLGLDGALLTVGPEEHLGGVEDRLHEDTVLARVVRTCSSHPSQWDAWTTGGRYLYFRYRHGEGSVEHFPGGPDPDTWDEEGSGLLARWQDGSRGGAIDLADFLAPAGLRLAPNSEVLDGR
ncbi:hypothetical protein ACIPYS_23910 [Kitasatospora sp. NPDC089913]|uniref:hypothetical protein n=1 Tax=Kitasatospora sp. NPDC089913 TaxID=3364080 RepID=UPI0037FF08E5